MNLSQPIMTDKAALGSDLQTITNEVDQVLYDMNNLVNNSNASAVEAKEIATEAKTTADAAATTANSAADLANNANNKADTAITTANTAKNTAEGVDAKATEALQTANEAKAIVDTIPDWVSGSFTNPNPSKFTTYNLNYRWSSVQNELRIFGNISASSNFTTSEVLCDLNDIAGVKKPSGSNITIYSGANLGSNDNAFPAAMVINTNGQWVTGTTSFWTANSYIGSNASIVTTIGWA